MEAFPLLEPFWKHFGSVLEPFKSNGGAISGAKFEVKSGPFSTQFKNILLMTIRRAPNEAEVLVGMMLMKMMVTVQKKGVCGAVVDDGGNRDDNSPGLWPNGVLR